MRGREPALESYGGVRVEVVYDILGGVAGLGLSAWGGYSFGLRFGSRSGAAYWIANGFGLVAGVVLSAFGFRYGLSWLWIAGFGVMAGGTTGLKYGSGRVMDLTHGRAESSAHDRGGR